MPHQRRNQKTGSRSLPRSLGTETATSTLDPSWLVHAEPDLLAALIDTLAQIVPGGIAMLDRELRYRWLNQQLAQTNCLPVADHLGRRVREIVPELADVAEPLFRQVLDSGVPLLGLTFSGETPGEPGELRHWEEDVYPLRPGGGQEVEGLVVLVREVTAEHREARAQTILAHANGVLAVSANEDEVIEALLTLGLPSFADLCAIVLCGDEGGIRRTGVAHVNAAKGRVARELWRDRIAATAVPAGLAGVLADGEPELLPVVPSAFASAVAQDVPVQVAVQTLGLRSALTVPLRRQGRIVGALQFGITESSRRFTRADLPLAEELAHRAALVLERAELYAAERQARTEAEAANQLRDTVVAQMAHDLKSPLTVVRGQVELALRQLRSDAQLSPEQLADRLGKVAAASIQMARQIDQLLDRAHLQAGQPMLLQRGSLDLVALARQCVEDIAGLHPRHRLSVHAGDGELWGDWDESRLQRVIANLLENAVKYSPDGGAVTVRLNRIAATGHAWAVLAVADEGIGIAAADLPRLFAPFQRGANAEAAATGTGLGLASARFVVEAHGGSIEVASQEGVGSTFTVRLPL